MSPKKKGGAGKASVPVAVETYTPKQADKHWDAAIADLKERQQKVVTNIVQYHYDEGLFAMELVEDKLLEVKQRKYGQRVVPELAVALAVSESSVYQSMKFARTFDLDELAGLKEKKWPWRQIQTLLTVEDPDERKKVQEEYENGSYGKGEQLREAVVARNNELREKGERDDNRGKRSGFMEAAKTAAASVTHATGEILPMFIKALKDYSDHSEELEDKKQEKFAEFAEQVKKTLPATKKLCDDVTKAIKLAGL